MLSRLNLIIFMSFMLFNKTSIAEVYKCKDSEGKISYSDQPCATGYLPLIYKERAESQHDEGRVASERIVRAINIHQNGMDRQIVAGSGEVVRSEILYTQKTESESLRRRGENPRGEDDLYSIRSRMREKCRQGNNLICKVLAATSSPLWSSDLNLASLVNVLSSECASGKTESCERIIGLSNELDKKNASNR